MGSLNRGIIILLALVFMLTVVSARLGPNLGGGRPGYGGGNERPPQGGGFQDGSNACWKKGLSECINNRYCVWYGQRYGCRAAAFCGFLNEYDCDLNPFYCRFERSGRNLYKKSDDSDDHHDDYSDKRGHCCRKGYDCDSDYDSDSDHHHSDKDSDKHSDKDSDYKDSDRKDSDKKDIDDWRDKSEEKSDRHW